MQPLVQTRSPLDWSPPRPFHCETIPPRNEPTEMLPSRSPDFFFTSSSRAILWLDITASCTLLLDEFRVPPTALKKSDERTSEPYV